LYDFAEFVPLFELEQFEVDELLEWGGDVLLGVDEVEQILSQIVQIASISLSRWRQEYLIMALA
jgi:hypothetical protein